MDALDTQTKSLVKPLEVQFAKFPVLPVGVREFIVNIAPWVALILGVLAVVGFAISILGLGAITALAPIGTAGKVGLTGIWLIPSIIGLVEGVLWLLAYKPLKNRALRGWNLLFWVTVLGLVSSLVTTFAVFSTFSLVWVLIWLVVELYFLFQIKSYYK